jgi:cytochrome c553
VRARILRIAALLAISAFGGLLVVVLGLVPIAASSGHWPITEWFLHFAMERSVATHSLFTEVPLLDDPALVLKGAAHYHAGCGSCHGTPEQPHPVIAQNMLPPALYLGDEAPEWKPEQLFYVVKHGVKFTGMPAWPARERDDEAWAVVAFLQELPGLDPAEYRRLALGEDHAPAESPPIGWLDGSETSRATLRDTCVRCHGADGLGRGGAFPRLAGQRPAYLQNALEAYARGERASGIMQPIAARLTAEQMRDVAAYYASLDPEPPASAK